MKVTERSFGHLPTQAARRHRHPFALLRLQVYMGLAYWLQLENLTTRQPSNQGIEAKLDALLALLQGSSERNFQATPPTRRAPYSSMFHTPTVRGPKPKGRNETLVSHTTCSNSPEQCRPISTDVCLETIAFPSRYQEYRRHRKV